MNSHPVSRLADSRTRRHFLYTICLCPRPFSGATQLLESIGRLVMEFVIKSNQ